MQPPLDPEKRNGTTIGRGKSLMQPTGHQQQP